MANKNKKKKGSSQTSRQAAAAYKGKNSPSVQKPQQKKIAEKDLDAKKPIEKETPEKPIEAKKPVEVVEKSVNVKKPVEAGESTPAKPKQQKKDKDIKSNKSKPKFKADKIKAKKARKEKISEFGINRFLTVFMVACLVIAAGSVAAFWLSTRFYVPKEAIVDYAGRNISDSQTLPVTDDIEAQHGFADLMKCKGDTKKFRYYAANEIVFSKANTTADLNLVNVFDNNCVIVATIVDESGDICYRSLGLPAGRQLTEIFMGTRPYGHYDMKLVVAAYDAKTYEYIGVQYSDLSVQIGNEDETAEATTA